MLTLSCFKHLCFVEPEIWKFKTSCREVFKVISYYYYHTYVDGCRQNLDSPSGPLNFFSEKKVNCTQCVCYKPRLLLQLCFLRFSIQLKRRCSPPCLAFPSSHLVLPRGIRNFLAIATYSELVIFKLHGLLPFCFPPSLCFPWPVQSPGVAHGWVQKILSCFSLKKCKTFVRKWYRKMMNKMSWSSLQLVKEDTTLLKSSKNNDIYWN